MKKIIFLITSLLFWSSCDYEQLSIDKIDNQTKGIVVTDLEHDPEAKDLFNSIRLKYSSGRISADIEISEIYKYFDIEKDIVNYSINLQDTSDTYFENLVISKIGEDFYGFILRYVPDKDYVLDNGFKGLIQRYNLNGELIGQHYAQSDGEGNSSNNASGRTKLMYQCVVGYETSCWEEYEISTATGLPLPETLTTVCVNETIYGWCGDTAGPMPNPYDGSGWGTYIPATTGSGGGTSGNESGSTQYDPYSPDIVPIVTPNNYKSPVVIIEDEPSLNINSKALSKIESSLMSNPAFLVDIPCGELPKWQTLAQNKASQIIKDKINQLDQDTGWFSDWAIQTLNGANGTIVNMDYFSVNVTILPNNPSTNQPFTAEGFLDYFRRNINDFAEGSTFLPYCETPTLCTQETALWNSNNPTGAIVYIDIPGDDGVVVCSDYTPSYWYFMTLEAPGAGNHPVSGTRQFGFEPNGTGYNFFVRGVDRFDSNTVENTLYMATLGENPFFGADALWTSFQNKLKEFVNNKGGNASVNVPIKYRPDWEKVKDVLEGNKPVSDLGCK